MTKQIEQSIVRIKNQTGAVFGAGFLVADRHVVSCSHVVADSLKIDRDMVDIPMREVHLDFPLLQNVISCRAKIAYWDVKSDIVLLELISSVPNGVSPIELTVLEDYNDCGFTACGFPKDGDGRVDYSHGKMYGRAEDGKIMIESDVSHMGGKNQGVRDGYSGGPVWHNGVDKLAGMTVERLSVGTKSYIIPNSEILVALSTLKEPQIDVMNPKNKYLTWMLENSKLPLIKHDVSNAIKEQIPVISVYTALSIYGVGSEQSLSWSDMLDTAARSSVLECLNQNNKLVILGDAGTGKTTFVNFVVSCLAGHALGNKVSNFSTLTDENLLDWNHGTLLPVRILLRNFILWRLSVDNQKLSNEPIWQYIEENLKSADFDNRFVQSLKRDLRSLGGLVFFDGLDEVPEMYRQQTCEDINGFVENFPDCRYLVTSRLYAYQPATWQKKSFKVALLAPLESWQIKRFIDRWYKCVADQKNWSDADVNEKAKHFYHAIQHERLLDLAENPLLLTLMVSLYAWKEEEKKIPRERESLYAKSIELFLNWEEMRNEQNSSLPTHLCVEEWRSIKELNRYKLLNKVAFKVHKKQSLDVPDSRVQPYADIQEEELILDVIKASQSHGRQNLDVRPLRLIEYLCDRAQLIVKSDEKTYAFIHRTFQEYLAACYLANHQEYPEIIVRFVKKNPEHWREVASLAGVMAFHEKNVLLWELIEALTEKKQDMRHEDYWCIHIASRIIADVRIKNDIDDTIKNEAGRLYKQVISLQENLLEIITGRNISPSLDTPLERAEAGINLAVIGDPRFHGEDQWCLPKEEYFGFKPVRAGKFIMGWGDEGDYAQHILDLPDFWMAKYPVSVQQFRIFCDVPTSRSNNVITRPVVDVKWFEAWQYAERLHEKLYNHARKQIQNNDKNPLWAGLANGDLRVTLSSEAEWEKAARGQDGNIYPWDGEFNTNRANVNRTGIGKPSVVGCFPKGLSSQYGIHDMIGNVWEWTRSIQETDPDNKEGKITFKYPYQANDGREIIYVNNERLRDRRTRVLRGGAFDFLGIPSCYVRQHSLPKNTNAHIGFRVCISSFKPQREE